jgi:prophage maintenance system killer protein
MEDLTVERVAAIHARVAEEECTDVRVLSEATIHQMVFHANLIPVCVQRAAFVFWSLCAFPAFRGGNTGTALAVSQEVLAAGGLRITGDPAGMMAWADAIHAFVAEPEEIEQWLRENTGTLSS